MMMDRRRARLEKRKYIASMQPEKTNDGEDQSLTNESQRDAIPSTYKPGSRRRIDRMVPWCLPNDSDCSSNVTYPYVFYTDYLFLEKSTTTYLQEGMSDPLHDTMNENVMFLGSENQVYLDFGDMNDSCKKCGALMWYEERSGKSCRSSDADYSICCMKGKVVLPYLSKPPLLLWKLIHGIDARSAHFMKNIRSYNSMFAFTSIGGKVDTKLNNGGGPPQFMITGQNCHQIGSLLPFEGDMPKFAQLYIYDTGNEIANRMFHFSGYMNADSLDATLVNDLLNMVDEYNVLAKSFRQVRDCFEQNHSVQISLRLFRHRPSDARMYNLSAVDEVATHIIGDFNSQDCGRDIILRSQNGDFQKIHETHTCYIPLQYPLLFPYGEDGFREDICFRSFPMSASKKKRVRISLREFIAFRLHERSVEQSVLLKSKKLLQQFIVDCYSMVEAQRLSFIKYNQHVIRFELLMGLEEAVHRGDTKPSSLGTRVVLPSSFIGGRRYMRKNCQDAMSICKRFGYPDLFLTFTCNPKWPEISRHVVQRGLSADERPDIVCRVFRIKLDNMMMDFKKGKFFGDVVAGMYTIEFQKRGLPHAHILLWLDSRDKLQSVKLIDSVICAEFPNKDKYPKLFQAVSNYMVHGPCGMIQCNSQCMKDGRCSKLYPKKFSPKTTFDGDGYPIYRRRDTGITTLRKDVELDNRYVIPYNPKLLMKYQAHINLECCNKFNSIKYLFKCFNKGVDRVTIPMTTKPSNNTNGNENEDEIKQYYDCRYLSPYESIWRIFAFDIHHKWPPVQKLTFHLPRQQVVMFKDTDAIDQVVEKNIHKKTMFLAWMEANIKYPSGRHLTYGEFPMQFVYYEDKQEWHPRKRGTTISRLNFVPPSAGEMFYLRLLLSVQRGCTSYESIKTINNRTYDTFQEACGALELLTNDKEFIDAIREVATMGSKSYMRRLFVTLLLSNTMNNPCNVWEQTWELQAYDILYDRRKRLNNPGLSIKDDSLKMLCLIEIEKLLCESGKSLKEFEGMPCPETSKLCEYENIFLVHELSFDRDEMIDQHIEYFGNLNCDQRAVYNQVIDAVNNQTGGVYFVYGYSGTGKTFLWKTLTFRLRSENKIVLNVASSGIASLLLPGGRTAHSQFAIPLSLNEDSCCNIKQGSAKAELLQCTSLIIWDEAPMINKWAFEALDRTLRDIMRFSNINSNKQPFGGKVIVFGGDFRQILPVIPRAHRAEIVMATINSSRLWKYCKVLKLEQNMRLQNGINNSYDDQLKQFGDWILDIGDGNLGVDNDGEADVEIPKELLILQSNNHIADIVEFTYPKLVDNMDNFQFFESRAILAPTLEVVEKVNEYVLSMIPGEGKEYLSCDSICRADEDIGVNAEWLPTELLNDIKCSGLPDHRLMLKVGVPIMLMRNIDISAGLCNGTRLIVVELGMNVIRAKVISGSNVGNEVYIPRMNLIHSNLDIPLKFQRRQFPLCICFAMTINKSQGQTLSHVGLYLPRPVFSHGQLYVALSRVRCKDGMKILICNDKGDLCSTTKNVVYKEVFQNI